MLPRTALAAVALVLAAAVAAAAPVDPTAGTPPSCATVPVCVARLRELANPDPGISQAQDAVARRLQVLSPDSIGPVVALLRDADPGVREVAGYVLRDMPGLDERHLPELARAVEAGDGWLPPAIASIGSPEAVRFLVDQLKRDPEDDTQLTAALAGLGARVVPDLVGLFECRKRCDQELLRVTGEILADMEGAAVEAAEPLARVAADQGSSLTARRAALRALARLGPVARPAAPALLTLWKEGPREVRDDALRAVAALGGAGLKDVFEAALQGRPEDWAIDLVDLAALGAAGSEAGPAVEKLLDADEREVRVAAARTLGFIGHEPAVPALETALGDPDDWRLPFVAAESLGRLRATHTRASLTATASSHWFAPVRAAARTALEALEGRHLYPEPSRDAFAYEFRSWDSVSGSPGSCVDLARFAAAASRGETLDPKRNPALAKSLSYDREVRSYGPDGERVDHRRVAPDVGLRVDGAWLLGKDQGEWGGELVLKPDGGQPRIVLSQNVTGLHALPDGPIVAVTGLAHLSSSRGALYRVVCAPGEACRAAWWKALPRAPRSSRVVETGELLVDTDAGAVLVAPDGGMRMVECPAPAVTAPASGS